MAGGGGKEGEPEFQVAPMVDVLLVILIFFMSITTAQVLKVDKTIHLPTAPDAQKKDNQRAEGIVNVRWLADQTPKRAEYVFEDKVYAKPGDLVALIKNAKSLGEKKISAGSNPTFRIVIRADKDVPARYVSQAMDSCAAAGIVDISFSTTNK